MKGEVFRIRDVTFDKSSRYQPSQMLQPLVQEQIIEVPRLLERPSRDNESDSDEEDADTGTDKASTARQYHR